MLGLKSTLIVSAVLLALLAVVVWRNEVVTKKLNAARVENATLRASVEEHEKARERDRKDSAELVAIRDEMKQSFKSFEETLRKSKVTSEIRYVDRQGNESVCIERDAAGYRGLFNQAVTGGAPGP